MALDYSFCQGLRGTPCVRIYDEALRGKTPQYVIGATDALLPRTRWGVSLLFFRASEINVRQGAVECSNLPPPAISN